jgi:hypothetical protein
MATMAELVARVTEYLAKEDEGVRMAVKKEEAPSGVGAWWPLLMPYYGAGLTPMLSYGETPAPSTLFLVKRYLHPKQGEVFRCWVSENARGASTYRYALFLAEERGELRIVAVALNCLDCRGTGIAIGGAKCGSCGGAGCKKLPGGWGARQGFAVARPGRLLEVRRLSPPSDPHQLQHYNTAEKLYTPPAR